MRKIDPDKDYPFIYSTWRKSLWHDMKRPEEDAPEFFRAETKRMKKILSNPDLYAWVAVLSDDQDFILGYSIAIELNLEWVYVRDTYRKQGIATLIAGYFTTVSPPQTKIGKAIVRQKKLKMEGYEIL